MRILVLTSGRILVAAGIVLILTLELDVAIRALLCLAWLAAGQRELIRIERGFESCIKIRLSSDGKAAVLNNDLEWSPATLRTGSVVLRKFAWLRLQTSGGEPIVELLRGNTRHGQDWRHLQVIWRHIGADG